MGVFKVYHCDTHYVLYEVLSRWTTVLLIPCSMRCYHGVLQCYSYCTLSSMRCYHSVPLFYSYCNLWGAITVCYSATHTARKKSTVSPRRMCIKHAKMEQTSSVATKNVYCTPRLCARHRIATAKCRRHSTTPAIIASQPMITARHVNSNLKDICVRLPVKGSGSAVCWYQSIP